MSQLTKSICVSGAPHRRHFVIRGLFAFLALCAVWLLPTGAQAGTGYWLGTSSSNWNLNANWNGNVSTTSIFNGSSTNMTVNLDANETLGSNGGTGGLSFTGTAFSVSTGLGYNVVCASGSYALTINNQTWVSIDPNFTGNNVTETVAAPIILGGGNAYFSNMTADAVSFTTGAPGWFNAGAASSAPVNSGTHNLLVISGSVTATAANTLGLWGPGSGQISGNIVSGAAAANVINLSVNTLGTWTLSGSNSFVANATVNPLTSIINGTLALDFTAVDGTNNKINSASYLTIGSYGTNVGAMGGTLKLIGNAAGDSSQSVKGLNIGIGSNAINLAQASGTTAIFNFGAITGRNAGGGMDFGLSGSQSATNGITTLSNNANYSGNSSILGGYATVNQTDWAVSTAPAYANNVAYSNVTNRVTMSGIANGQMVYFPQGPANLGSNQTFFAVNVSGSDFQVATVPNGTPIAISAAGTSQVSATAGNITALASYANDVWLAANNTTVTGGTTVNAATTNSLRFNSGGASTTLNMVGSNLIRSGGILVTPNVVNPVVISGGTLSQPDSQEFSIQQNSASPLTISSVLTGNTNLAKYGSGTLILSGSNTFTAGWVFLDKGKIQLGNSAALGSLAATGQPASNLLMGNTSILDLNGYSPSVKELQSDNTAGSVAQLQGNNAATKGLIANVTNSAAGTLSTLTIGSPVTVAAGGSYYGGFTEVPGSIISLNYLGAGMDAMGGYGNMHTVGAFTNNNAVDQNGMGSAAITITGGVTINQGASWGTSNGGNFNMMGALTVNGLIFSPGKSATINTTYLQGNGAIYQNAGNSQSLGISVLGSNVDSSNVKFGTSVQYPAQIQPLVNGVGTLKLNQPIYESPSGGYLIFLGGVAGLTTPAVPFFTVSQNDNLTINGEGTFTLTGGSGSTAANPTNILPGNYENFYGSPTIAISPSGSGQAIYVSDGGSAQGICVSQRMVNGGVTLKLDAGANTSVTLTELLKNPNNNNAVNPGILERNGYGSLTIAAAQGLSNLGTTDVLNMISTTPSTSFPSQTNATVPVTPNWIVGANASGSTSVINGTSYPTGAATYLTYNYTGNTGSATDAGFVPYVYPAANINNVNGSALSSFNPYANIQSQLINSGTQTVTNWAKANTLEIDNATLDTANWNFGTNGLILNGGKIVGLGSGQGLILATFGASANGGGMVYDTPIYVSPAGGLISANIGQAGTTGLNKFGPGILTLTGTNNSYGYLTIGAGVVDVGTFNSNGYNSPALSSNGPVNLRGGVLQASGTITMGLGSGGGQVNWSNWGDQGPGGGFSARNGVLKVALGGLSSPTQLIWGGNYANTWNTVSFLTDGGVLNFGSTNSNNVVNLVNNIDLGVVQTDYQTGGYSRVVSVVANTADAGLEPQTTADYTLLSGTISASNPYRGLAKAGNGVLVLGASNTYTGATTISGGAVVINSDANLGVAPTAPYPLNTTPSYAFTTSGTTNGGAITPGAVQIWGGATLASGTGTAALTISANRSILLASGATGSTPANIDVYVGNTITFGGLIGDYIGEMGNLGKTGAGTLVLSGSQANPFTAGLTILNGTVQDASPNNSAVFGAGPVTFGASNTPTLDLNGCSVSVGLLSGAGSNGVVTTSSNVLSTLTLVGSGTQSYAGAINNGAGTVALTVASGAQILTGANGFTGAITLNGGTLQATNAALNSSSVTNGIVFNGGALQSGAGGISTAKAVAMTGAGTFDTNGNNSTLSGNITGVGGALTKAGNGTLVLSGLNNTFSGGLIVNSGTVQAGSGAGTAVLGSGNVSFGTANTPTVDLNGNSVTVGLLSGLGTNGVVTSSVAGAVTVTLAGSGNQVFGGGIQDGAGQVSLTVNSGAQILTGVSSYSGQTSVYGGSLTVTGTGAISNSSGLSIGGNGTFNFVTGTTGQVLTVQNLTTPYDSGISSFGVEVGNSINVVHSPTGYRTLAVNLFAVPGMVPDPTFSGTQITVLTAPDSLDNYIGYTVGNVYGATNFTVTVPPASNNPSSGLGNTVSMQITGTSQLTSASWLGAFAAGNNVWAISNGSTASNWTTGGAATSLVPGAATNVTFSNTSANVSNMSLGATMAVNSLTISATNSVLLQDAMSKLTVSGAAGIVVNAGAGSVTLNVAGLTLNGAASQALTANNANGLLISGPVTSGANGVTVNGTNTVTLTGNDSFAGPFNVTSAGTTVLSGNDSFNAMNVTNGTVTLSGANTFSGTLTLNSSSLLKATGGALGTSGTTSIALNGGTLQALPVGGFNTTDTLNVVTGGNGTIDTNGSNSSITGQISGAGTLFKNGIGTLTISGSNAMAATGSITINQGTLRLAPNTSGTLCAGTLTIGSTGNPILDLNDNTVSVGAINTAASYNQIVTNNALDSGTGILNINVPGGTAAFYADINDGNTAKTGLIESGSGILQLWGNNSGFSGGFTILGGTAQGIGNHNQSNYVFGTGILTFGPNNSPTLDINPTNGNLTTGVIQGGTNAVIESSANSKTLIINGPGSATFGGTIKETALGAYVIGLQMGYNAGNQTLTGSNAFTGAITLNGGILNATTNAINGASTTNGITFNGGTLQAGAGGITTGKAVTVGGQYIGIFDTNGNDSTLSGVIGGATNTTFEKTGAGKLTITNASNSFTGMWDLAGGVLNATQASLVASNASEPIIFAGGTLQAGGSGISTAKNILLASGNASSGGIDTNSFGPITLSGVISGVGGLVKSGTDQLILSGNNTFAGGLTVLSGTVQSGAANVGELGIGVVTFGASNMPAIDINGHNTTVGMLSGGTNGLVTSSASGALTLTLSGTGTGSAYQSFSGIIQPGTATSLALTMSGTGTQVLNGANIYAGPTTISGGILSTNLLASGSTASGIGISGNAASNLVLSGGVLQYTGPGASIDRLFTLSAGNDGIDASGSGPLVFNNTGALVQTGGIYFTLSGSNTGANTLNMPINQGSGSTALIKSGPGTWVLTGTSANIFQGGITINGGVLAVQGTSNSTDTFGVQNGTVVFNGPGATLQATGPIILLNGQVNMVQTGIIDTQANLVSVYSQVTSGTGNGGLVKQGSGTLILGWGAAGNNTFNGLTINNGTVQVVNKSQDFGPGNVTFGPSNTPTMDLSGLGGNVALLSGGTNAIVTNSGTANNTQTLSLTGTGGPAQTFAGTIQDNPNVSGSGGYVQVTVNGGTQVLSGVSTYTGWTTVSGSTAGLVVTGSLSGSGQVSVQQGGTLMGTGLVGNVHTTTNGSTIAPGTPNGLGGMNEGTLSVTTLGLDTGGTNAHLAMTLGGTTVGGITPSSRISTSGGIWVSGADLQLTLATGYTPAAGDTFFLTINGGAEVGTFATLNGVAGSYGQGVQFTIPGIAGGVFELSYNGTYGTAQFTGAGHDIALYTVIPEPGTWALLLGGMGMLGLWQRRRSNV